MSSLTGWNYTHVYGAYAFDIASRLDSIVINQNRDYFSGANAKYTHDLFTAFRQWAESGSKIDQRLLDNRMRIVENGLNCSNALYNTIGFELCSSVRSARNFMYYDKVTVQTNGKFDNTVLSSIVTAREMHWRLMDWGLNVKRVTHLEDKIQDLIGQPIASEVTEDDEYACIAAWSVGATDIVLELLRDYIWGGTAYDKKRSDKVYKNMRFAMEKNVDSGRWD